MSAPRSLQLAGWILAGCGMLALADPSVGAGTKEPTRNAVAPDDPRIAYMGRVELSDKGAQMGFPGITIRRSASTGGRLRS